MSSTFAENYIPHDSADWNNAKRILIFQCKQLGDALLLTPVVQWLHKKYPQIVIDVVCKPSSSPIFSSRPNVESVFELQPTTLNLVNLFRIELKRNQYDMFLDFHGSRESILLAFLTKAGVRCTSSPAKPKLLNKIWTHCLPNPPLKRHAAEKNLDVLRRLGMNCGEIVPPSVEFAVQSVSEGENLLPDSDTALIVVHPVANWMFKTPSVNFWTALLHRLVKMVDGTIVVTGGSAPLEIQFCKEIEEAMPGDLLNLCGQTTITQLGSIIDRANFYIGIDTFASHIAAGCGVNGVVFFGPTCESTWGPYQVTKTLDVITNPNWHCRPCHLDGCGGGKKSECLNFRLQQDAIIDRVLSYVRRSLD